MDIGRKNLMKYIRNSDSEERFIAVYRKSIQYFEKASFSASKNKIELLLSGNEREFVI